MLPSTTNPSNNSTLSKLIAGDIELSEQTIVEVLSKIISEIGLVNVIYWLFLLIFFQFLVITLLEVCNVTCTYTGTKKNKKYYQNLQNNGIKV